MGLDPAIGFHEIGAFTPYKRHASMSASTRPRILSGKREMYSAGSLLPAAVS
jgi:hypothetical protein